VSLAGEFEDRLEEYDRAYAQMVADRDRLVWIVRRLVDGVRLEVHPSARGRLDHAIEQAEIELRKHGGV
jgi:hypothetical protein